MPNESVESKRIVDRPSAVRVLFVGESPPTNGTFFYFGNSNLVRYTHEAFAAVFPECKDMPQFLNAFRDLGCYLVDLCREPVNGLPRIQRLNARQAGIATLTSTIRRLAPTTIVIVMKAIEPWVSAAIAEAEMDDASRRVLPFPAQGHQREYVAQLTVVLEDIFRESG